ncbi:MAG: hypothetical protein KC912_16695 [Proteobacteria bacterium]|nr:hypothetical protein [Pseudomonadota bacterium]
MPHFLSFFLLLALAGTGLASAQEVAPVESWAVSGDGLSLVSPAGVEVANLPCPPRVWTQLDGAAWLACGDRLFELTVAGTGEVSVGSPSSAQGLVVRIFEEDGRLWTEVRDEYPLSGAFVRVSPSVDTPSPSVDGPAAPGQVVSVEGGVVINLGSEDGLELGDLVELYEEKAVVVGSAKGVDQVRLLVGKVVELSPAEAGVRFGVNEYAEVGTLARRTTVPQSAGWGAPPRVGGVTTLHGTVRASGGPSSAFAHGRVGLRHRAQRRLMVDVQLNRLRLGGGRGLMGSVAGQAIVATDQERFAIGGGLTLGTGGEERRMGWAQGASRHYYGLVQYLRLGSVDGFVLDNTVTFLQGANVWPFALSSDLLIPVFPGAPRALWVVGRLRLGLGDSVGEAGLRARISGDGRAGTSTLTAVVGETQMLGSLRGDVGVVWYGGLTLGVTAERTF